MPGQTTPSSIPSSIPSKTPARTKLIHALWGDGPGLLDADLRDELAAAGVRRLQVNLDDTDIAPGALRLATGAPIRSVVSTWTTGPADAVTGALRGRCDDLAGWRVEERLPLEPPAVPDGHRTDALANLAFLRRPVELERDAWLGHWLGPHTTVAVATQATFGYVQNVVLEPIAEAGASSAAGPVAGIVEELFPAAAVHDVHAFYGSDGDQAELDRRITRLMASVAAFGADRDLDLVPTSRYVFDLAGTGG